MRGVNNVLPYVLRRAYMRQSKSISNVEDATSPPHHVFILTTKIFRQKSTRDVVWAQTTLDTAGKGSARALKLEVLGKPRPGSWPQRWKGVQPHGILQGSLFSSLGPWAFQVRCRWRNPQIHEWMAKQIHKFVPGSLLAPFSHFTSEFSSLTFLLNF